MTLRDTLFDVIATLDRIAPSEQERLSSSYSYSDEKLHAHEPIYTDFPDSCRPDNEKVTRLSYSTLPSIRSYYARSRSLPTLHGSIYLPSISTFNMKSPKMTWRHAVHLLTMTLSFLSLAVAIIILGLAADNINWSMLYVYTPGQGNGSGNMVTAWIFGESDPERPWGSRWITTMNYLPENYNTKSFALLIAASGICVLLGLIITPLSAFYWKSSGSGVKLGKGRSLSNRRTLLICLVLETITFIVTLAVLANIRELYYSYNYSPYDRTGDEYSIVPKYFDPPLPSAANATDATPIQDGVFRLYRSPVNYDMMTWNCRLSGHASDSTQNRLSQLCKEGNAARWLLPVLLVMQMIVLASHAWAWVQEKRSGKQSWAEQRVERLRSGDDVE